MLIFHIKVASFTAPSKLWSLVDGVKMVLMAKNLTNSSLENSKNRKQLYSVCAYTRGRTELKNT